MQMFDKYQMLLSRKRRRRRRKGRTVCCRMGLGVARKAIQISWMFQGVKMKH